MYDRWIYKLLLQSVPITAKAVSLNPAHGEVYSRQHYVITFVSALQQVSGIIRVSSTNKTDRHDITKILFNVAVNIITQNLITPSNTTTTPLPLPHPRLKMNVCAVCIMIFV